MSGKPSTTDVGVAVVPHTIVRFFVVKNIYIRLPWKKRGETPELDSAATAQEHDFI